MAMKAAELFEFCKRFYGESITSMYSQRYFRIVQIKDITGELYSIILKDEDDIIWPDESETYPIANKV